MKNQSKKETDMGKGQELYRKAKTLIPGGTMLLSKRPEMFLPEKWPAYYSKAKGCMVWDLDGNEFLDMSIMAIGTNILGYANDEIDDVVIENIRNSNMSTLNCPEEVILAEKLVELNPWSQMVRFARSGGEANAIGIRIARAASGKDKVAICGYHGWHDWYLSANLGDDTNLAGHLLPGLDPSGVPKNLKGSVLPFNYNKIEELESLFERNDDIGVIKMEVSRNKGPENNFLEKVRELATRNNAVLVFDECTSGFRQTFGGLYKLYGVEPDVAIYGKALGNGFGITAVVGKREVMEAAQKTFISSTFWTERVGPTAAVKTLEIMERIKSWEIITQTGKTIAETWQRLADQHHISINISGIPALVTYSFNSPNSLAYKTFLTQEMLKKNILATTGVYSSTEHKPAHLERYFNELEPIFETIKTCEEGRDIYELLESPVCHGGFKRLN
ncbi:MAG: aminotransferase class III-fold pyridoxal phosphate-dependent enzyme [Ginsengibacter sp.]